MTVELSDLGKTFGGSSSPALAGIDLTIPSGELLAVVGASGSGKTTLLRLIAGLELASSGRIRLDGRAADDLPPHARDVAMVFQNPALFPHLSVRDNLGFSLKARREPRARRVEEIAALLRIDTLLDRRPNALSGGERQRVALGRALTRKPKVLLLDEPFVSLDAPLRAALRADVVRLHRALGLTTVLVTHDQADALADGDRVAVLERGRLLQCDAPGTVYERPASRAVGEFVGSPPMDVIACEIAETATGGLALRGPGSSQHMPLKVLPGDAEWAAALRRRGAGPILIGIRPEHLRISADGRDSVDPSLWTFDATITRIEPQGHEVLARVELDPPPDRLTLRLPSDTEHRPGAPIRVNVDPRRVSWFDPVTNLRIA